MKYTHNIYCYTKEISIVKKLFLLFLYYKTSCDKIQYRCKLM